MNEMIARASAAQAKASDPAASVFVSANAGTGKTKLLTDRVLRLLLSVRQPMVFMRAYTRAAAAEMRNRILNVLPIGQQFRQRHLAKIWKIWACHAKSGYAPSRTKPICRDFG